MAAANSAVSESSFSALKSDLNNLKLFKVSKKTVITY